MRGEEGEGEREKGRKGGRERGRGEGDDRGVRRTGWWIGREGRETVDTTEGVAFPEESTKSKTAVIVVPSPYKKY